MLDLFDYIGEKAVEKQVTQKYKKNRVVTVFMAQWHAFQLRVC